VSHATCIISLSLSLSRLLSRSFARSLSLSLARSLARSFARSLSLALALSRLIYPPAPPFSPRPHPSVSLPRSICHYIARSLTRVRCGCNNRGAEIVRSSMSGHEKYCKVRNSSQWSSQWSSLGRAAQFGFGGYCDRCCPIAEL
jgi:hypothetical protein